MRQIQIQPKPFYYLANFQTVLEWIAQHHIDLLIDEERTFITRFPDLPIASRALLVRMIMRKGQHFRSEKLRYDEIGCTHTAAQALLTAGWVDDRPLLNVEQLFALMRKKELAGIFNFPPHLKSARKADQLDALRAGYPYFATARPLAEWRRQSKENEREDNKNNDDAGAGEYNGEYIYHLRIGALCDRLRLMFFGNLHQDWSEFVLSELGIFKYEKVALSAASQGFQTRGDVDDYLHLHQCRERFYQGEPAQGILPAIPAIAYQNDWLENRRAKLLFLIAQEHERSGALSDALRIYADCPWPGARIRAIRVLERCEQSDAAFMLAESAGQAPENEAEQQQLARILPRLRRRLGLSTLPAPAAIPVVRHDLILNKPDSAISVETLVLHHLTQTHAPTHSPAYYVENTLINSLFGLLCWDAVFAIVPGAFFHPFQSGPADLLSPDFRQRRERAFLHCFEQLDSDAYRQTILQNFHNKAGTLSPFVFWDFLTEELLTLALHCLPPAHLRKWFERMLLDIRANRSGYPDLIQFFPAEKRYRMIEVKGPGDRLQDNQIRWLEYCAAHDMPLTVCYVQWADQRADSTEYSN
ncbi:MAG TPA: VRR-NUC domain-containing protein [Herbaspirillum sp.]